jgi:hypothetical protein
MLFLHPYEILDSRFRGNDKKNTGITDYEAEMTSGDVSGDSTLQVSPPLRNLRLYG